MLWVKNKITGLEFEIDNEAKVKREGKVELKYQSMITRLMKDPDFEEIDSPEERKVKADELKAEKAAEKAKLKAELKAELAKEKAKK